MQSASEKVEGSEVASQWGDFQTPPGLVSEVSSLLGQLGSWPDVLEPTCGVGNFIDTFVRLPTTRRVVGLEANPKYVRSASDRFSGFPEVSVLEGDIFRFDLRQALPPTETASPLLIVGNPPWVTNAAIGVVGGLNLPDKVNIRNLSGLDAMTGASNFDIAEAVIIRLLGQFLQRRLTLALLVKPSVARNAFAYCLSQKWPVVSAMTFTFDAKKWFNVSASACLFILDFDPEKTPNRQLIKYPQLSLNSEPVVLEFDKKSSSFYVASHKERAGDIIGESPVVWRQGIKHDCTKVMELKQSSDGRLANGHGDSVDAIEQEGRYPFLKGSDLYNRRPVSRQVIVTQSVIGEDTQRLQASCPQLWSYLQEHSAALDGRKSSIYRGKPRFSMFGIGPYSFAPYKVAYASMYRVPRPVLVTLYDGRPIMLDDTCYFIPFWDSRLAAATLSLLREPEAEDFFAALTTADAKRVVTKRILQQLDLVALAEVVGSQRLSAGQSRIAIEHRLKHADDRRDGDIIDVEWYRAELVSPETHVQPALL